jgi:hypothetical protein
VRDKFNLTRELVKLLPEPFRVTEAEALATWWKNLKRGGGMRLTKLGYGVFSEQLELEHYEYKVEPFELTSRMIIQLDRKLQDPWYLKTNKNMPTAVVFFGSKEAMTANLYRDLKRFLNNY